MYVPMLANIVLAMPEQDIQSKANHNRVFATASVLTPPQENYPPCLNLLNLF
jgi:hypothetical protein